MIEARGLVEQYRSTLAVDHLSFDIHPGTVTGFLGPNGAGKSTTMRMIMGLDRPDAGQARIGGKSYGNLRWPLREVGALLEARRSTGPHRPRPPDRARRQQRDRPATVEEMLASPASRRPRSRRAGQFSLGMSQRLGIAAALLGDPAVLLLDEPAMAWTPKASGGSAT